MKTTNFENSMLCFPNLSIMQAVLQLLESLSSYSLKRERYLLPAVVTTYVANTQAVATSPVTF
jgi:hypothetical protein